jgi:tetratricopeptide (TPR) repeat protein
VIHGNLLLLAKRYKTAEEMFSKAIQIIDSDTENLTNESSDGVPANKGLAKALIMQGKIEQASQFITLLNDVSDNFENSLNDEDISGKKRKYIYLTCFKEQCIPTVFVQKLFQICSS